MRTVTAMARNGGPGKGNGEEGRTGLVTKTRPKTKRPHLYKVLLLNDDYTPMEFVVHVLEKYFNKGREEATRIEKKTVPNAKVALPNGYADKTPPP